MRVVAAMMKHETNTFSPVPTALERFGPDGPAIGRKVLKAFRGTNTPLAAYIDLLEAAEAELVTPVAGDAMPSGPVEQSAYESMCEMILEQVNRGCDAVMLDLHGAMVTQRYEDGEGELLARIRSVAPHLPIAVALDLHANVTHRMVENATVILGYRTYPHVDMYETGKRAGSILLDALAGRVRPVMRWRNTPVLAHTLRMGTDEQPMKGLIATADALEQQGLLAVTVFGGFPLADIPDAGVSAVSVADGDERAAETAAEALMAAAWEQRNAFVYTSEDLSASVARASRLSDGPILLIDHADNCASGGTQDTMAVVEEVMRQGLEDVAVGAIVDPEAVKLMSAAGLGVEVSLPLGGKTAMPAISSAPKPLKVEGRVRALTDGHFVVTGPMYTGVTINLGPTAVLDTGKISFVVTSRHFEPFDLGIFRSVGIEPTEKRYLLLKSRIHYRASFQAIAKHVIECAGIGVTSSDYSLFNFQKLRRPMFPIDPF